MDSLRSYGSGLAGSSPDLATFMKKPQVILRLVSSLLSVIVFACLLSGGYIEGVCICNKSGACNYVVGIGIMAFIAAIAFLIFDYFFEQLSNSQQRKYVVMADISFSVLWAFFWFVGFCYLTNQWAKTSADYLKLKGIDQWMMSHVRASIAFTFFSIFSWAGICYLAVVSYREGSSGLFASSGDIIDHQVPGSMGGESYHYNDAGPGDLSSGVGGYQDKSDAPPASYQAQPNY